MISRIDASNPRLQFAEGKWVLNFDAQIKLYHDVPNCGQR